MAETSLLDKSDRSVREFRELIESGLINSAGEFVPTLMYPPMMQHPPMKQEEFLEGFELPKDNRFTVYAHFPFCIQQCSFCHFPNIITNSDHDKDVYLDHLEKEMDIYLSRLGIRELKARSILLGGGTPTFQTPAQLKRFMNFFTARVNLNSLTQFSCDLDPLTMIGYEGRERLRILKSFKVTRLAMGVQAFSDEMLKQMGRHHNAADTARAIGQAKEMGFKVNIELIYGYPGETPEHWAETVRQALSYDVDEIMIYRLKILPYGNHTGNINKLLNTREDALRANDAQIRLKAAAINILEDHGYGETTTRFFSKTPQDYSYYSSDWMGEQLDNIGFGNYAMSMLHDRFAQNTSVDKEYYDAIQAGRLPIKSGIIRTRDQQLRRNIVMPLKNRHLPKKQFQEKTGVEVHAAFGRKIELLKKFDLLEEDAETIRPTRKGRFFIDEVTQFFYHPDFMPFSRDKYQDGPLNPHRQNETLERAAPASSRR